MGKWVDVPSASSSLSLRYVSRFSSVFARSSSARAPPPSDDDDSRYSCTRSDAASRSAARNRNSVRAGHSAACVHGAHVSRGARELQIWQCAALMGVFF